MKRLRKLTALFLCMLMMIPSQGMTVLAETAGQKATLPLETEIEEAEEIERIEETLLLEEIENTEEETLRIKETLALEPIKKDTLDEGIIYWNPGGVLPEGLATASNAQTSAVSTATASNARIATASNAKKGSDDADGLTASTPVKTLVAALERAEQLQEEEGLLPADITIYAMSPMEIADGQLYALNGGNICIKSWPGRPYDSDVVFYVNGGQLTMMNVRLASGNPERADDEAQLIYVRGGGFQMGQNVILEGRVVLDYRDEAEEVVWETATASDATVSNAAASKTEDGEDSFDLNEYILTSDEDSVELIEDSVSASTWRDPVIELVEGFDGGAGEYLLEILDDGSAEEIELVKTLYSDAETEEEFLSSFTLVENAEVSWNLLVETQAVAQVRNTGTSDGITTRTLSLETEILTQKTLVATRAGSTKVVYWNPGGNIVIGNATYYAGNDSFDGSTAEFPVKTWEKAIERAEGGTIICMQTLDLGASNADDYLLTGDGAGTYLLKSSSIATMAALGGWSSNPQPAIRVPAGKTLILQDVELVGVNGISAQAIACDKGDIIINENVIAETGYIQVTAFKDLEAHPIKVTDITDISKITLFFSGINNSYDFCYMDVVVPYGELAASITEAEATGGSEAREAQADLVGSKLLGCFQLHSGHSDESSKFNWILRQDTYEDDGIVKAQNLELYAMYYFDAIYLDGVNGDDIYYGATCQYPVKTWERLQERWAYEMKKSVDARWAAYSEGRGAAYIEEFYPLPKTIYICGTVTVEDSEEWDLWKKYRSLSPSHLVDYDGSTIVTEVVPHMDIPYKEDGATLNHEIPKTLVKVTGAGNVKIKDVTFRNITDDADSVTIQVEAGGSLTLTGSTLLTGERLAKGSVAAKAVTLGTHVKVSSTTTAPSTFIMDENWTGAIEKRQHGVNASGSGTEVTMNGGSIQKNNSFEQDIYNAYQTGHKPGAGVLLSDQARFTMNGGKIAENTVYQYGAGVYMVDAETSFIMNKGEISGNKMNGSYIYNGNTTPVNGVGIGIYAGTGTKLTLGDGVNPASDVQIKDNMGYRTSGVGVWSDGELNINKAAVSGNYTGAVAYNYYCYGIGIYVGPNATLNMTDGQVTGNYSSKTSSYGNAQGAGLYFASNSTPKYHTITGSTISDNIVGYEYSNSASYSAGGGIYMTGTTLSLTIKDSVISGNQAYSGGGIYINSTQQATAVTIENTMIQANKGAGLRYSGEGGGIYFIGYGSLTLRDGVKITGNVAQTGGGIRLAGSSYTGCHLNMMSDTPGAIQINDNEATSGGGIYHTNSSIHAKNATINGNKATTGGGIYTNSYGYYSQVEISKNEATSGGGIYATTSYNYMKDCAVTDNVAVAGGGFYSNSTSAYVYLSETSAGDFKFTGNHAETGGGIHIANGSQLHVNIAGPIQNSASVQGSNLYLSGYGNFYLLAGEFKQPKQVDRVDGVYNIFIDDTSVTAYERCFDWTSVTAESKTVLNPAEAPEVIYLNTGNSYLMSLIDPPNNDYASFPIDVNTDVFKTGSVVVKPAYKSSVAMQEPKAELDGPVAAAKSYTTRLVNAAVNVNYISGGILPRRTQLGGFKDPINTTRTNVILVGEGVYLSGEDGDDTNNNGTSPTDAVKTFGRAKEVLKERIEAKRISDEALPAGEEKTGYSPFIYICGQVDILDDEEWVLDYEDGEPAYDGGVLFTITNQYYKEAEINNDEQAYPAQVRRFASFVRKPMVKVGDDSRAVSFETGKIIINGMAEAVVLSDQSTLSPIIEGRAKSKVTLNGESQITNNYNSGLDIYGELTITGEEGETNKQVYNHHGNFIRVGASGEVKMVKEGRIYADDTMEKVGTIVPCGIRAIGAATKITMSGNSVIIQESGNLLGNGSTNFGIYTNQNNSSIKMSEKASIENYASAMYAGIYIGGSDSSLEMSGKATITAVDASITYNIYAEGTRTAITMIDNSNITQSGTRTVSNYGIWQGGTDVVITMKTNASIACTYAGIWMGGTRPRVEMKDNAQIFNDDTLQTSYGIYLYSYPSGRAAINPTIVMTENASIHGSEARKMTNAIYASRYSTSSTYAISNLTVEMNMNADAGAEDSARLYNCTTGYYLGSIDGASLSMGKKASITADTNGYYQTSYSGTNSASLLMRDNSRIADSTYGMYFYSSILTPVNITLKDEAAIEQNTHGIFEAATNGCGLAKLDLQMSGKSRISGNSQYGIYLWGRLAFTEANGYYHNITLNDSAMIGGDTFYNSGVAASGNYYSGIYANSPIQLVMNDKSKITGNGSAESNTSINSNGIYLTRYQSSTSYYRAGTANITLNDNAAICNNRGSMYIATIASASYPNPCEIVLNGIQADGTTLSAPSIQGNTDAVFLGTQATLKLQGGAVLGSTTYETSSYAARALDCYGYLELDGRSRVTGTIYLQNGQRPITMTNEVVNPTQQPYDLHLVEGFIGQIVVKPGGSMTDVTAPNQIGYFSKVSAEGMAADRPLVALSPNIVLLGENNVYLSGDGSGDDTNSGNSPSTPVRTFKRAKELLETEGYFTTGANIIICKSTVQVLAVDYDWSFGTGGMVTNAGSGNTWKPLVIRASDYDGVLITLVAGTGTAYASTVTFKNITIDGGAAERSLTSATNDWLLQVGYNKTAVLGEGAVLQNNKAATITYSNISTLGVYVHGGTLEIDGGTITGMERSTTLSTSSARYFSSAISCQYYNTTYPGKVIMKSGQIVNNTIDAPNMQTNPLLGAIYLNNYCTFEMSGGLISNNTVNSRTTSPCYGGAIVNQNGAVTISGGIIRANQGGRGSAVYCVGTGTTAPGSLTLSGGQITGNTMSAAGITAQEAYSPVYINGYSFQLKGGGTDIQDGIYLATTNGLITISDQINQTNRRYRVYLNQGTGITQFKKGSVVVQPDVANVTDATPYLSYFDVRTHTYVLDQGRIDQAAGVNQSAVVVAGVKESQCLILMKAVYLDSVNGSDASSNDGLTPAKAVKTFARAKTLGGNSETNGTVDSNAHYIIYVSGKAYNTGADTWTLPKFAYMCRYTGFAVYTDTSGTATTEANQSYYGFLIEPQAKLTLQDIAIYGRRTIDAEITSNGDSLVHIKSGIEVIVQTDETGAILADNYNFGSYIGENGIENLTSMGGAFHVAAGGILRMDGGVIQNTKAAAGSAIYLGASASDQTESGRGRLILTGTPDVSGKVYLDGTGTVTAAYIEPEESYHPSTALQISIGNDHNGRQVIQYPAGITPGTDELKYYLFDDAIKAMYDVVNRSGQGNILELNMRQVIYLDGQNGDDVNNDGSTPAKAYKTLKKVFESIGTDESKYGIVVFVVDTVEVSGDGSGPSWIEMQNVLVKEDNGNSHYEGYYTEKENADETDKIKVWGQVYFKRYAQPKGYQSGASDYEGFDADTLKKTLFDVKDGGTLTMKGIYLDGHSQDADNSNPTLVADGVVALSPLVTVGEGGTLHCQLAGGTDNLVSTATLFTNNINGNQKTENINTWDSSNPIYEGSSAGIELLDGGECYLEFTEFSNLQLGEKVIAGGTDIYSNGDLHVSLETYFTGTVYLEGFGTADERQETSRYITVEMYGTPVKNNFQVLMRDPYMGRTVVKYPDMTAEGVEPPLTHIGYYRLEERVKDYFCLNKRSGTPYIFELQVPVAVYIDGINGDDGTDMEDPAGRLVGSTPEYPVKSLKRAFDLLSTRGGNTIYVVGTIQVSANTQVTGMSYEGTEGTVLLGSTSKVRITRYIQPDFAVADPLDAAAAGYDVPNFTGVLLTVKDGVTARFGSGVYFDGHSEPKTNTDVREYADEAVVSSHNTADAPMITVASGGTLTLSEGTTLQDNHNIYPDGGSIGQDGGAIANSGTVNVNGALFKNNEAKKGSVVYQDGIFNIQSKPENLKNHIKAFYLTTDNSGTAETPVWGTDHVIRTAVAIPDDMIEDLAFDVDMDHAVKGRPVVRFTDSSAYSPDADAEHEHFKLGSTVGPELFLVESETDPELLELQNWEILKVEVPTSIYLVMSRKGVNDASAKLQGIMADAPAGDLLTAPEYTIENKGNYDAKVSISGFKNQTSDVGIDTTLYPLMDLTDSAINALDSNDLYLAVKGLDDPVIAGTGFGMAETSLKPYAETVVTANPAALGTLASGTSGNFTFIGAVGSGFMDQYMDSVFPIEGSTGAEAQAHMDGTSGIINARAKYLLRYKVEIDPSRR